MKISYNWLLDYIKTDLSIDRISEILTDIGLEVEGLEKTESIPGGLQGIVVGKVLTCEKHPDADKLSVTTVDLGGEEPQQIVCGAPNVAANQSVVVATVGATLYPSPEESFKIKKSKIRGVQSLGMLCAEDELGLGNSHDGIIVLEKEYEPGTPAADVFNVETDTIIEIGLTPNRSDATGHLGVAQDLAAYVKYHIDPTLTVQKPAIDYTANDSAPAISIEVKDTDKCPRYAGIKLDNITVKESPEWIKNRLNVIGVRPINNVVDITNYVLHEYGQPLHAFDFAKISGGQIKVQTLPEGTKFTTLDEAERSLHADDLLICDASATPMCLAGVFGGATSGVSDDTTSIFLESAHFEAINTRKSSTRHLLRTDAAKCFEKGADPNIVIEALARAVHLLEQYADAKVASPITDIYPTPIEAQPITVRTSYTNRMLGTTLTTEEIEKILTALSISIIEKTADSLTVKVPTNKADVLREVDVIEEILRIYGFNNIEFSNSIKSTISVAPTPDMYALRNHTANHLSAQGFKEMMAISLGQSKHYKSFIQEEDKELIYVNNTSNTHLDVMRPNMLFGGLEAIQHNVNRQNNNLKFYEFGFDYSQIDGEYVESEKLSLLLTGKKNKESWNSNDDAVSFFTIKSAALQVLTKLGVSNYTTESIQDEQFSYGIALKKGKMTIAKIGKVRDSIAKGFDIKQEVFFAEIHWYNFNKILRKHKVTYQAVSKYPKVRRDLALVIDKSVTFQAIETIARKTDKKLLTAVNLFDIYESKEHLGEGKLSYSVSFDFQDQTKTLNDKVIDKIMNKLIASYEKQLNATIRK